MQLWTVIPMADTVELITETNPMQRESNRGLAIDYIHADLDNRALLDLRTSYFFYDADKDFYKLALNYKLNENGLRKLFENTKIRYYSKGIV